MKPGSQPRSVSIPVGQQFIQGDLTVPPDASAAVIFAHGSGSSRHSTRNEYVAEILQQRRLATLLIDLLTVDEERVDMRTSEHRFDIDLLAGRLIAATDWARNTTELADLPPGYFG